jgi:hypothetical protein
MNTLTLINQYPNKINIDLYTNLTLVENELLDSKINSDYKYEILDFGNLLENKTIKHLLKTITKTIKSNYNLVYIKQLLNKTYRSFYIYHNVSFILHYLGLRLSLIYD